jgi:hypothetical protein
MRHAAEWPARAPRLVSAMSTSRTLLVSLALAVGLALALAITGASGAAPKRSALPGTLPSGKSLRGVWFAAATGSGLDNIVNALAVDSISYEIPLAAPPAVHVIPVGASDPSCPAARPHRRRRAGTCASTSRPGPTSASSDSTTR